MFVILPSWIPLSLREFDIVVSTKDLSFIPNLFEVEKMKLFNKVTFNTYQAASLFSLVTGGRGDILIAGNRSKEKDS